MITFPKVRFDGVLGKGENGRRRILENPYFIPNKTITKTGIELETSGDGTSWNHGMILAANGFALAAIPVQHMPCDVEGSIPLDALKREAKRAPKENVRMDALEGLMVWGIEDKGITAPRAKGHFPNIGCLVNGVQWGEVTVALDIDILMKLADALCERKHHDNKASRHLRLTIRTANRTVLVEPLDCKDDRWGIIMPMQQRS